MILVQLPSLLGVQVLTEWFSLEMTCKTDTASCNTKIRSHFLELLGSDVAVFPPADMYEERGDALYFKWLVLRRISVDKLCVIDSDMSTFFQNLSIFNDSKTAQTLTKIDFIHQEDIYICDIYFLAMQNAFPNLSSLDLGNFEY
jgi:hypothetical protein